MIQEPDIKAENLATPPAVEALKPPSPAGRCHARLMLMRLFAQFVPGTEHCKSLSTEDEIIECMAKRHPTLFIT
jgi:hypothetical protein